MLELHSVGSPGVAPGEEDLTSPDDAFTGGNFKSQVSKETLGIKCHPRNALPEKVMMISPSSTDLYGDPRARLEDLHLTVGYWNPGREEKRILVFKNAGGH